MTKVLLTGAGGFAGAHALEHILATTDWDVIATDSFLHKGKTDRIREVLEARPSWERRVMVLTHDLTVPFSKQAKSAMYRWGGLRSSGEVKYIVAYASESHVDRSITDPVPFIRNNTAVALSTLELARELKPESVVWVSTDEVYGPVTADNLAGHDEWATILPSNPYSASKAAQEAIGISYWRTYGVPLLIVNGMNMFGERQDPEKFIPMTIRKVLAGELVKVHGTPEEIGTRHYLHARNMADGITYYLNHFRPLKFGESDRPSRLNIASPDRIDNLTMAQMIAAYAGKTLRYELEDFHRTRPGHDPHYGLNPAKFEALGWVPPVPLEASLKKTVEWTIQHPEWLDDLG